MMDEKRRKRRRRWMIGVAVVIGIVVLLSILGATVFKARKPITTVNSVSLRDLDVSLDALQMKANLNVSLDASVTVKNPNKVGLRYEDSSAFMEYRGQVVGQAPIPADQISAGQTKSINLTLTVMADRLLSNSRSLISDLLSGTLPISTRTRISGKVTVLFFKGWARSLKRRRKESRKPEYQSMSWSSNELMAVAKDCYQVLGVGNNAIPSELKKAFYAVEQVFLLEPNLRPVDM